MCADICIIKYSIFTIYYSPFTEKEGEPLIENPLSEKSLDFAAKVVKFCIKVNFGTKENIIT